MRPSYETIAKLDTNFFHFFIDETEIQFGDKKYLALCFVQVASEEVDKIEFITASILRRALIDPFAGGRKSALKKKKLHYVDATEDLKATYISELCLFPYKAYVAYGELQSPESYNRVYLSLIERILPHRLMWCDGAIVELIFEENSKLTKLDIEGVVNPIHARFRKEGGRCPIHVGVNIGKKDNIFCFSMPDFLLGVFGKYAKLTLDGGERNTFLFEKLRDKYRVILDTDSRIVYSRKRPFSPWTIS